MSNPDSWVRSAYTVFWSRPGASSHDYQPLGATRRPRPRRLRGWLPLATLLLVAVLGLSTLGLVHRPGRPLGVGREAGGRLTLSRDDGQGGGKGSDDVDIGGDGGRTGQGGESQVVKGQNGESQAEETQSGEPQVEETQDRAPQVEEGQNGERPAGKGQDAPRPAMDGGRAPPAGQPAAEVSQHQRSAPEEVLVVLKPAAGARDGDSDASGKGAPASGD